MTVFTAWTPVLRMTLLILLLWNFLAMCVSFAQEGGKTIPLTGKVTDNSSDNIDFPYYGEWGWHKVHARPLKRVTPAVSALAPTRKIDLCFKCHDKESSFRICDPHIQLDKEGNIIREKCIYCHREKPDEKSANFSIHPKEITFNRDPDILCMGCHSMQYYLAHPMGADHLRKPSYNMLVMMKETEDEFNIVLPLGYDGRIMCATCHNPHQKGVIPEEREAAGGASEQSRVRLPGVADMAAGIKLLDNKYMTRVSSFSSRICLACHRDKM